ncbi:Ribonucleotide reductase of class III (anaerobic), large subunit [Thioalkalivibrio nitratireducens DSM 14787]|uniref:Ribonucleotide reductase of class III (Anaerobic), large subunit n=1 Tax=Thioalkalivibrio nitratireducens (strain DSM 14787 / UNIQEM 213 / ALEN2) TaxID=1255043 RepID=L0DWJ3_THIND|nr:ribonucleoside triphosphate reductase [Thioalkalivibrio nitratireducens]AGA33345.1 Ribonucleotide reductase of class III (anaerobic), large subunit [Thioalkalivibrio nitratireducens DSM 14787]
MHTETTTAPAAVPAASAYPLPTAVPDTIRKRDGSRAPFDADRIQAAMLKAGRATGEFDAPEAALLTAQVLKVLAHTGDREPGIERIQNIVEQALISANHLNTARAYIVYREQHARLRQDRKTLVDVALAVNEYLDRDDWRVAANANQGYSLGGLILNSAGKMIANYWLNHVYPPEIGQAHRDGDLHIHDLDMLSGYCAGWSLRTLLHEGLNGVPGKVEAGPPRHMSSAVGQIVNFLGTLQNEWAGAQAFSSFDTYMAPFVRKDGLDYPQVRQYIQELIYNLNVPSRWGTQTPFTNLTFDWVCPEDLREQVPVIGGEAMPFTYGELQHEMDLINRAYIEVMTEGDAKGRVFTFPIPTYNITPDFPWESENAERLFAMTARYGLPYFQNFVNSELSPHMVRSMCCRLQLDLRELLKRGNGLFGSAEQTGSLGVVTINCARLGYRHRGDEAALLRALDRLLALGRDSLELKRKVIQRHMDAGLFPYTKRYLGTLRNHFSTLGVNGIHEMIRNFTDDAEDITTPGGHAFALRLLDHVRARMGEFQEQTGHLYNLEATPAEGTTYRFAREDRKRWPNILQAGTGDRSYYTNSSQLPAGFTDDPFEALERQEALQARYTGGTVLHLYMGERISSPDACRRLVRRALENFRLPYITVTPTFSICPVHGYLSGEHEFCPRCDEELITRKQKEDGHVHH